MNIFQKLSLIALFVAHLHASSDSLIQTDRDVANILTIIVSTSPIDEHPEATHITAAVKSFYLIPGLRKCKKIIVFDGVDPKHSDRAANYEKYKRTMEDLVETSPYFQNTELLYMNEWRHLAGSIREAIKQVTTPFVLLWQHDHAIIKEFDLIGCLNSMIANPKIHYIFFSQHWIGSGDPWFGAVDNVVEGGSFVPLERIFGWSDGSNLSRTAYLRDFILPMCGHGFMETDVQHAIRKALSNKSGRARDFAHAPFGCYVYENLDGKFVYHSNGRWNRSSTIQIPDYPVE